MNGLLLLVVLSQTVTCLTTDNTLSVSFESSIPTTMSTNGTTVATSRPPSVGVAPRPTKSKETLKTDAPMLNYIFDTHSAKTKHHHHDTYKWGPHFDESDIHLNGTTVTVQVGGTALLNCRVIYLQDKTISWVRRNEEMQLLTVGKHTYSGDERYSLEFQYPGNWRLQIKLVNKKDEGLYECQISTHPPKVIILFLYINAPEVSIIDEHGLQLLDKYYESDSTIQLLCIVRHVAMSSSVVLWHHGNRTLNYDITRGGISVKTELMEAGANSTLSVARVNKTDSGNYTCSISMTEFATVAVHILNEESMAELHHGSTTTSLHVSRCLGLVLLTQLLATGLR